MMVRRLSYTLAGGFLSLGAPLGLLAIRLCQHGLSPHHVTREVTADPVLYAYVGTSTAIAFSLFGYMLGRQADRLADLSETDALTGLYNARGLSRRLDTELARSRRYREPLALLLVDLDGLKHINDRQGHAAGDQALRHVAEAIRTELRESDVGARWGGDEFAIVASNTSETAARALAERVRALIARPRGSWPLTGSLGVILVDVHQDRDRIDSATLMRAADTALYEAKARGGNTVAIRRPSDAMSQVRSNNSSMKQRGTTQSA
jgi:diguanylate cyclase (GGDEF)-like protein